MVEWFSDGNGSSGLLDFRIFYDLFMEFVIFF